jgi:hypothetical protein
MSWQDAKAYLVSSKKLVGLDAHSEKLTGVSNEYGLHLLQDC